MCVCVCVFKNIGHGLESSRTAASRSGRNRGAAVEVDAIGEQQPKRTQSRTVPQAVRLIPPWYSPRVVLCSSVLDSLSGSGQDLEFCECTSAQGFNQNWSTWHVHRMRSVDFQGLVCTGNSLELSPLGALNSTELTDLSR